MLTCILLYMTQSVSSRARKMYMTVWLYTCTLYNSYTRGAYVLWSIAAYQYKVRVLDVLHAFILYQNI